MQVQCVGIVHGARTDGVRYRGGHPATDAPETRARRRDASERIGCKESDEVVFATLTSV